MTIAHKKIIGEDGLPEAAVIPWDVFEEVRDLVGDDNTHEEWRTEIQKRVQALDDGTAEMIDHEDAMMRVRQSVEQSRKQA